MNLVEEIFRNARRSDPALIADGTALSYGELIARAEKMAVRVAKTQAARVGLDCPNGIEHVVNALGIVRAGKCLVPIASELAPPERARVIRETRLGAVVDAAGNLEEVSVTGEPGFPEDALERLNPAFIRFSSGTTGRSKGVVLSHQRLWERIEAANGGLAITPTDRVMWVLPMAHHFAVSLMLYLAKGACTVLVRSHLAEDVLGAARTHGGTVLYGAPFHHALLAAEASGRVWPGLRLAVSTAAALPLATARGFENRFGVPLSQGLGVIEVGLPLLNLRAAREKPDSVGRPLPGYEVRLREGELHLRGPGMLDAYLSPWRTAAEICPEGWFATGDLARVDAEGDVFIDGRAHSVINVAGLKCFPEEIEAVLGEMPGIAQARVFGRPHPKVGAVPVAQIVPVDPRCPPSVADITLRCRERLARYKVPVEFAFVESLPLTASGKLRR
jgi:long-chain acyl-CoA synthetase